MLKDQKFSILYGEHLLDVTAENDLPYLHLFHSIPLAYDNQIPIIFNISKINSPVSVDYEFVDDVNPPNRLLKIGLGGMSRGDRITIRFDYFVVIRDDVVGEKKVVNVEDVEIWKKPSASVQSNNLLIKTVGRILKGLSHDEMKITKRISYYSCFHNFFFTLVRHALERNSLLNRVFMPDKYWPVLSDALSSLILGGLCNAQTNLAVALLRSIGIPARVLIGTSMFYGKSRWMDAQHYFFECFLHGYGWIKGTPGRFPDDPTHCILLRISYPEDEETAGNGLSYYGGSVPWFWFSEEGLNQKKGLSGLRVSPGVRGWVECGFTEKKEVVDEVLNVTKKVWEIYTQIFRSDNFVDERFIRWFACHKDSVKLLVNGDVKGYVRSMNEVYKNYVSFFG
ncbi:MAG: hypothetical protein DRN01_01815 [Thermoplasmata archaeon]|nr:MAG: hypothetical protein DRN01_01815 [Thermoplasmata archaeon]